MKKSGGINALLIELVVVLFFFILSFSVLAQVYTHAYLTENQAAVQSEALFEAQNVCALLRGTQFPEEALENQGFAPDTAGWKKDFENYSLLVKTEKTELEAGIWWQMSVSVQQADAVWFTLPASCYAGEVGL